MELNKAAIQLTTNNTGSIKDKPNISSDCNNLQVADRYTSTPNTPQDLKKFISDLWKKVDTSKIKPAKSVTTGQPHKIGDKKEFKQKFITWGFFTRWGLKPSSKLLLSCFCDRKNLFLFLSHISNLR